MADASGDGPADGALPADADAPMHLVLVDASAFVFRAFHALPPMSRLAANQKFS